MNRITFCMVVFCSFFSGCNKNDDSTIDFFSVNKSVYVSIVEQLKAHSRIEKIAENFKLEEVSSDTDFDEKTTNAYDYILAEMKKINSSYVEVFRNKNDSTMEGASFSVYSGNNKADIKKIIYISPSEKIEDFFYGGACLVIDSPSWYLCERKLTE